MLRNANLRKMLTLFFPWNVIGKTNHSMKSYICYCKCHVCKGTVCIESIPLHWLYKCILKFFAKPIITVCLYHYLAL